MRPMQRSKTVWLTLAAMGLLLTQFFDARGAAVLFSVLAVSFPVALLAFPPAPERIWRVTVGLALLLLLASTVLIWSLPVGAARVMGLPPATWVALIGIWLAPWLLLSVGYAALGSGQGSR